MYPQAPRPNPQAPRPNPPAPRPCQWFMQGDCRWGSQCRFSHNLEPAISVPAAAEDESPAPVCAVCMEPIHLFAILLGCEHPFCMPCIHRWRTEVSGASANEETVKSRRSCPLCRAHTDYVISSPVFVQGEAKEALKRRYLAFKEKIPCRDWVRDKKCKFGGHCFYAHLDSSGECCKQQQREEAVRRQKRRGTSRNRELETFETLWRLIHMEAALEEMENPFLYDDDDDDDDVEEDEYGYDVEPEYDDDDEYDLERFTAY